MTIKPKARQNGLLIRQAGSELVVYDTSSHSAHALNEVSASIWQHCDGSTSIENLVELVEDGGDERTRREIVTAALVQLEAADLLDDSVGLSRGKKVMLVGAAALMVPVVDTIFVSRAAATCGSLCP